VPNSGIPRHCYGLQDEGRQVVDECGGPELGDAVGLFLERFGRDVVPGPPLQSAPNGNAKGTLIIDERRGGWGSVTGNACRTNSTTSTSRLLRPPNTELSSEAPLCSASSASTLCWTAPCSTSHAVEERLAHLLPQAAETCCLLGQGNPGEARGGKHACEHKNGRHA